MSGKNIEQIWEDQSGKEKKPETMSEDEIRETTLMFSSRNVSSSRRLIWFDSIYKIVLIGAYLTLLIIGTLSTAKVFFSVSMVFCLSYLIFRNQKLHVSLTGINESDPVISVLQKRYDAILVFYPEFFINSSVTQPLFVFAGFQFYHFFRYGEDGFYRLLSDPVTYLFLILAFVIPYVAQKMSYRWMINEMDSILDTDYSELEEKFRVTRIKAQRRRRLIIFMLISFLGLALFLTLFLIMT